MSELTGLVQIDVDRRIGPNDMSVEIGQFAQRVLEYVSPTGTVAAKSPGEARKAFKAKEIQTLDKLKQALVVSDDDSFQAVGMLVAEAATIIKAIEVDIAPEKKMASELHKLLCDREANAQTPYAWIKTAGDQNLNAYRVKQRREAEEIARKEQEAAQKEQRRLQAEADEAARVAREAKRSGDMAAARQAQEQVAVLEERAIAVVEEVVHAPVSVPKIAGRVEKWPWVAECQDVLVFARAVLSGECPSSVEVDGENIQALIPNPKYGKYFAKRLEGNAKIPGWSFTEQLVTAQRTK